MNQLAGNLTTQVRAIAEVATAVTTGDLTREIRVEAQGEVAQLKDNINQMIENLRNTTISNKAQDWLKTNLAKFTGMMQGQRDIQSLAKLIMNELTPVVSGQYGAFYVADGSRTTPSLKLISSYAYKRRKNLSNRFELGEGLVGQAALEKKSIIVTDVPADYVHVVSGLGESTPHNIGVFSVVFEGQLKAVIELASFQRFSETHLSFLEQLMQSIGVVFNMIGASMRTEELLRELQRSNAQLEGRSKELEDKAVQLEVKNSEIANASASLEEKAKELSQISKYKSDFLANMSHELRTPLNSLLILARMLAENEEKTLTSRQVEFAKTIYASGNDLLALINEILDLSKIEAGKMAVDPQEIYLEDVKEIVKATFAPVAQQKNLEFGVEVQPGTPPVLLTDEQRLHQILKNLLSNAFKFTERGSVILSISAVFEGAKFASVTLNRARQVIAFDVIDTGVGIPREKQELIFEAFQQADTTTARKYGGTGLGLTISRELARLLGGELTLRSELGGGSTFTLLLPLKFEGFDRRLKEECKGVPHSAKQAVDPVRIEGKSVVLVDDDPRSEYAIIQLLQSKKVRVRAFNNAPEALEYLRKYGDVDLVIMDIVMPGMNGFEAIQEMRKLPALRALPILAFSGKSMPGDRDKCLEAGCSEFVTDPAAGEHLIGVVAHLLTTDRSTPVQLRRETFPSTVDLNVDGTEGSENPVVKVLAGRRLLIVDDEPRNLFAVTSFLESRGADVVAADSAREAIEQLTEDHAFDLILMDIMMPEMDGYEATRQIRKMDRLSRIPIIAVTAKAMGEDQQKAFQAGCSDFVPKPVNNDRLLMTLLKFLPPLETKEGFVEDLH